MNTKDNLLEIITEHSASSRIEEETDLIHEVYVNDLVDDVIGKFKLLPIHNVSNFDFEEFAKTILKYDYNELLSGKVAVCKKGENSTIVAFNTKEECYNWVIQNHCC